MFLEHLAVERYMRFQRSFPRKYIYHLSLVVFISPMAPFRHLIVVPVLVRRNGELGTPILVIGD